MRFLSKRLIPAALAVAFALMPSLPAFAAETATSDVVLVRPGETLTDDLYAGAISLRVSGTIEGDLIAAAAERVIIDGEVTGSVNAVTAEVIVNGTVGGSVRAAAGSIVVAGVVEGDLVVSASSTKLLPGSRVGGEVLAWGREMRAEGAIEGRLRGSFRRLELAGTVSGSVDVTVASLRIVGPLIIGGDLAYRSDRVADGLEQADVTGTVVQRSTLPPNIRVRGLLLLSRLLAVVFVGVAAVTTVWGWPGPAARASTRAREHPLRSWLLGAAIFASPAILVAVMGVIVGLAPPAAGLPLAALAVPLALAMLGVLVVAALFAAVPVATAVGRAIFPRIGLYGATLTGALVGGAVWLIPWIGWLVPVAALPLGLGAWLTMRGQPVGEPAPVSG